MGVPKHIVCEICSRSFQTKQRLEVHIRVHTGEKPYKCTIKFCNKSFAHSSSLASHQKRHSLVKKNKCKHCSKLFRTSEGLKLHAKRHFVKGKPFGCIECSAKFIDKHQLSTHFKSYHDPIGRHKFECIFCGKSFPYGGKGRLFMHILSHIGEKMYCCKMCPKEFKAKIELINHSKRNHNPDRKRNYDCVFCTRKFLESKSRKHHILIHIGEKPHMCKICGKEFTQLGNMKEHTTVHSMNRPFPCSKCSKSFKSQMGLKSHMTTHLTERAFKCELCKLAFKSMYPLQRHIQCVHTGEKLHVCQFCQKRFSLIAEMKRHIMRVHTPGKMVKCRICGKAFKCKLYARIHERRFHNYKMK